MSKIGYKLFRVKRGHLFPLYVLAEKKRQWASGLVQKVASCFRMEK